LVAEPARVFGRIHAAKADQQPIPVRADSVKRQRLVFFAHQNFSSQFDALGEISVQVHDNLALHPMRTAEKSNG
jgi:hypothetical protein